LKRNSSNTNVRAVERALQILGCFDEHHPERGVSEIAQAVGLHKATAHRIVSTLLAHGFLERADEGQRYRLGIGLANLGFLVLQRTDARREAMPIMTELAARLDETCDLSVYHRGQAYYLEVVQGSRALRIAAAVGRGLPLHATASGKVLLAHQAEAEADAVLASPLVAHTHRTITRASELRRQLEAVRTQGYAFDDEELELGVRAVAAPVRDRGGKVVAALGVACPTSRLSLDRLPTVAAEARQAAEAISRRLGWSG
jgi:IclR family transcriptional regulator, KDG regulon repressor